MFEWLFHWFTNFLLGAVPVWAWIIVAGVAIGWAWKQFGWQGVLGGLLAVLTLGAYRQGWRDRGEGRAPVVPVEPLRPPVPAPVPPKKRRTLMDILNGN